MREIIIFLGTFWSVAFVLAAWFFWRAPSTKHDDNNENL